MKYPYTSKAEALGLITFDEKRKYVTYVYHNIKRNYGNPEEKVQVEVFSKLLVEYNYEVAYIEPFQAVKMGSTTKEADIVVYKDKEHLKPWIVIECKHEEVSQAEFEEATKQAFSYANALATTTKFIWITKLNQEAFYKYDKESSKQTADSNIPYFGEEDTNRYRFAKKGFYWDRKGGKKVKVAVSDLKPIEENELTRKFKQAHDALWAGGELNPNQAFDELDKLIFCKIWDERKTEKGEAYKFQVYKGETNEKLKKRILEIYDKGKEEDAEVFSKPIDLSAVRIKTIVEFFQEINLSKTDLDSKGKAFETFIGAYFRGEFGQYFTPRNVVKFIVNTLPIDNESRVLDTSCGSGGFLLYALDKVRRQADKIYTDYKTDLEEREDWKRHWHSFASKRLYGIEINDQISRVAKMNMIIHDDGHTNVVTHDGLFNIDIIAENTGNKGFKTDSFDFIITNPPFGSIVKQSEKSYMKANDNTAPYYDFSLKEVNWIDQKLKKKHKAASRPNQSTEVLFLEQCHKFLKADGYIAIVVPDGILTNSSLQYVRDSIEDLFRIVAVVSLPQHTFTHTGAGVKTSVLFLRKYNEQTTKDIKALKIKLQDRVAEKNKLEASIKALEDKKKAKLKPLRAKDEATKARRKAISEEYGNRIKDIKEDIEAEYLTSKQNELHSYPIFMAIAESIGYDATGKVSAENDLEDIETELARFIEAIEKGTDANFR